METTTLDKDIKTICLTATSFPDGIFAAHQKLHGLLPSTEGRHFYAISYGNTEGGIIYKAAVSEVFDGEAEQVGAEAFTIKKGTYISKTLSDYRKNLPIIGQTFQEMLKDPRLDPCGYCLEMYLSPNEVQCLVKIKDTE